MRIILFASILAVSAAGGIPAIAQDLTIRNPAELNAYQNAIGEPHPDARAAGLEDFLEKYPHTVLRTQILNTLLVTYQGLNDQPKMIKTAKRLLDADPNNLRAAFAYVFLTKSRAMASAAGATPIGATGKAPSDAAGAPLGATGSAPVNAAGLAPVNATGTAPLNAAGRMPQNSAGAAPSDAAGSTPPAPGSQQALLDDAARVARAALKVAAPTLGSGISDEDFARLKTATAPVFQSAIAADELANNHFSQAIPFYEAELKSYPDLGIPAGQSGINETYLLGKAYLQLDPIDMPSAIFYLARAAQYAPQTAKAKVEKSAEYWYQKYHGGMDGFDEVKELARQNSTPPESYKLIPAPPARPAEQLAHNVVVEAGKTPDGLRNLALVDKEFILANGSQEDADKVWAVMKGVRAQIPGIVTQATASSVQLAVTPDAQEANRPDFTINFAAQLMDVPLVGSSAKFDAIFDSYTAKPPNASLMMSDGTPVNSQRKASLLTAITQLTPNSN